MDFREPQYSTKKCNALLLLLVQKVDTQLTFTCLKSAIETLEKGLKYVQSEL